MKKMIGVNDRGLRVGQDHQRAKLSDAAVELIRKLHEDGMPYRVIAEKFEITVNVYRPRRDTGLRCNHTTRHALHDSSVAAKSLKRLHNSDSRFGTGKHLHPRTG